ncbi:PilZ domain-containing protein [Sphingomonas sp. 37zxx]|uniref:PilZ domain-containing protein n=1 Tax=Sphingomonas sp. 37zxx TaxID=1550073 RepID=UPI00053BEEC3|nr:PilZ domain-containing protein [Sphingomonas sp. 37zxx]
MSVQQSQPSDRRTRDRRAIGQDTTIRLDASPLTASAENLSMFGMGLITDAPLKPGTTVSIGLPGLGQVNATIAWRDGPRAGCIFHAPLSPEMLALAFNGEVVTTPVIEIWQRPLPGIDDNDGANESLSYRNRLLLIVSLGAAMWGLIILATQAL